eukprot:59992-Prymnesium_polylepis.1
MHERLVGSEMCIRDRVSTEKDVGEVECGAAGDLAQSAIRASVQRPAPATPRPPPRPLTPGR